MQAKQKIVQIISFMIVFGLLTAAVTTALSVDPSKPSSMEITSNTTNAYPQGSLINKTRGYIYTVTVNESQPSRKWAGYVGNINGEYALQDASGNALYDWDIVTITGELYATKEGPDTSKNEQQDPYAGGIPLWTNMTCATLSQLEHEQAVFNHSSTDEDAYLNTFDHEGFTNPGFYAGEQQVTDTDTWNTTESSNCYGINLNQVDSDQPENGNWTQVVLTDGTYQWATAGQSEEVYDITYAVLLENDTAGFNDVAYDFQILLPQSGLEGTQPIVPYYFYVELI